MGVYDRDYVRQEGRTFLGAFGERGRVCRWLVGINVVAFIAQVLTHSPDALAGGRGWFTEAFQLDASAVLHGQVWRLLTYAFLHEPGSIWPILWNMLFLWWFGTDVEDLYGPREFLTYYLAAVLTGGLLFVSTAVMWGATAVAPDGRGPWCLGANGAVLAVLTLCAIHFPRRTILLFFILPVPLWLMLIVYMASDAYSFLSLVPRGAVGPDGFPPALHTFLRVQIGATALAHLGGALFAGLYYRMNWRMSEWLPQLRAWRRQLFRPRLRVYREEEPRAPVRVPAASAPADDEQLEAKVDAILEKISRVGKENLTPGERELLLRASEAIRRRRG